MTSNKVLVFVKLLTMLFAIFYGVKINFCQAQSCSYETVDLQCDGVSCATEEIKVSGDLCATNFHLKVLECDMRYNYEHISVFINGVYRGVCDAANHNDEMWHSCGYWSTYSSERFTVHLQASAYVNDRCYNSNEGLGYFYVYGRVTFSARHYSLNAPSMSPTSYPTRKPTLHPTKLLTSPPTRLPTWGPTSAPTSVPTITPSVSPTAMPTASPCQDKYSYCVIVASKGMCRDEDIDTRARVHDDCPVSCGTCFNSTLSPSNLPTLSPTLSPTSPTTIPTRKPTILPTRYPTVSPTTSPTCIDTIGFCGTIASFCNSSSAETNVKMFNDCASTCGYCSLEPTRAPTAAPSEQCVDSFAYCFELAQSGSCYEEDLEARYHFQTECPVSCGTCQNNTVDPTMFPSSSPTINPTSPTPSPSYFPSTEPSSHPTWIPTSAPTCVDRVGYCDMIKGYCMNFESGTFSKMITDCSATCGFCTRQPSHPPTTAYPTSLSPTHVPSLNPTSSPSWEPSRLPSYAPSDFPSIFPTEDPTQSPSERPSKKPSTLPSVKPTDSPSSFPTKSPTESPTENPSMQPSEFPSRNPSQVPSNQPSFSPSAGPTLLPTNGPSLTPSSRPSGAPSLEPSTPPSVGPTIKPTAVPTVSPTPCFDFFVFCKEISLIGACYEDDIVARNQIHKDCPLSCNTCYNNTVSPTISPSILPSGGPSEQPSVYPTHEPTPEPKCEDVKAYCSMLTHLCKTSIPEQNSMMKEQCSETCGYCNLQRSLIPTSLPTHIITSSPTVTGEGEVGVRRRVDVADSTSTAPVMSDSLNEMLFYHRQRVWIAMVMSCGFAFSLVIIYKCGVTRIKYERKNNGDFMKKGDEEMVYDLKKGTYFSRAGKAEE